MAARGARRAGMEDGSDLPHWGADAAEFCALIEKISAPVKIVLKTRDDPWFIERWIEHHARIVGPKNLIIFDNMSSDPEVLSVYRRYRGDIAIIRFDDPHYNLHHFHLYRALYQALANSSEYFIFIDTDEFLVLFDDDRYYADARILDFVAASGGDDLFPTTWLWNVNRSSVQFAFMAAAQDLADSLACGKPLFRSSKMPPGYVNHNFQLSTQLFTPPFKSNLFLLHLANVFPRQRISANVNKLRARGFVRPGDSAEAIAARTDIADALAAGYVRGIGENLAAEARGDRGGGPLGAGCLELGEDGKVIYYSDAERAALAAFLADPKPVYDQIPARYRLAQVPWL
jgi:hypothetical protein